MYVARWSKIMASASGSGSMPPPPRSPPQGGSLMFPGPQPPPAESRAPPQLPPSDLGLLVPKGIECEGKEEKFDKKDWDVSYWRPGHPKKLNQVMAICNTVGGSFTGSDVNLQNQVWLLRALIGDISTAKCGNEEASIDTSLIKNFWP